MRRRTWLIIGLCAAVIVAAAAGSIFKVLRGPREGTLLGATQLPVPDHVDETASDGAQSGAETETVHTTNEVCWRTYGRTPQRPSSITGTNLGKPGKVLWRKGVGSLMELPPSVCDGVIYANTAKGLTWAVDTDSGRTLWVRKTGTVFDTTPAIGKDLLVIAGVDGRIQALFRSTGHVKWRLKVGRSESSPLIIDDIVYAASHDGRVYAIELATGKVRWAYQTSDRINGSPVFFQGRIYIANYAGEVFALRARDGKVAWRRTFKLDPLRTERFYSSTPIVDGRVYIAGVGGYVYALSAKSGRDVWKHRVSGYAYSTPAIADGRVFVGTYGQKLYALDAKTGRERWSKGLDGSMSGSAVVVDDIVFVSTMRHNVMYGYSVKDGRRVWDYPFGRYVPGIATNVRYYIAARHMLVAMQGTRKPNAKTFPTRTKPPKATAMTRGVAEHAVRRGKRR